MSLAPFEEAQSGSNAFAALAELDQVALDALPEAVYLCAGDGRVVRFNQKAIELWGRTPRAGDPSERFCGSFRMYRTDGAWLPHDQCPMASALQTGESFNNEEVVVERPDGQRLTVLVNIAALADADGRINGAVNCFQDITARKQAEDEQRRLVAELNHRIKNTLATIQSVARNTARYTNSIEEFTSRFDGRLLALSQAHALLSDGASRNASLRDLLARQLEPFGGAESPRIGLNGPDVDLQPQLALSLGMMFHELATNAAKYGPLSVGNGRISIDWRVVPDAGGERALALEWVETDGPPVKTPDRKGFGTRLLNSIIGGLDGDSDLRFEPSGLQFRVSIPLRD